MDITQARKSYEELGFDTLPLRAGDKIPCVLGWERRDPSGLWRGATPDSNIGIRTGEGVAVLDCDEKTKPGTFERAVSWLATLGYLPGDYPTVQTASLTGRHIYMTLIDSLSGDYRTLHNDFGAGEFRYGPGAFVVAPPSVITNGGAYALIDGDFRQLPKLTVSDVLPLLKNQDTTPKAKRATIPRRANGLLQGKGIDKYHSNSEAEQALILSLVNAGHSFESVLSLFMSNPCAGKFHELRKKSESNAIRWLKLSYTEAVTYAANHESKGRRAGCDAIAWAESSPWPGRAGVYNQHAFIAHATIAHRAGSLTYSASCRELAELAGVSAKGATAASKRLCDMELLSLVTPGVGDCATIYQLQVDKLTHSQSTLCEEVCNYVHDSDAFRTRGLGKSAGVIYSILRQRGALSDKELAQVTGRHIKTVKRALSRMAGIVDTVTGELLPLVESDGEKWQALEVDLSLIARIVGTYGEGEKQRKKHRQERRAHKRALELGRKAGTNGGVESCHE